MSETGIVFCVLRSWAEAGHNSHNFPETLSLVCVGGRGGVRGSAVDSTPKVSLPNCSSSQDNRLYVSGTLRSPKMFFLILAAQARA